MILSDETYFIEFKKFINESEIKDLNKECDCSDDIECEKCDLKKETLSKK